MSAALTLPPEGFECAEVVAGRYELTRRIARGGMGEVLVGRDRSTGTVIALKRLHAAASAQPGVVTHFMREYRALSELRHPRIIEVFDYGVDRGLPYYTMELLDGQDLRDLAPLPYREACSYLRDVASSLALLHARRLLHRDVSPRNVRRTSDGRCKLIDFGAMVPFGVPPNVTGTPPCLPPEALQGAPLDQRSDLYSLGALAYYLLIGKFGREAGSFKDLPSAWSKPLRRLKQHVSEVPDELEQLVAALLSLDPAKRPKSAAEVMDWLAAIAQLPPDDSAAARSFMTNSQLCGREREIAELTRRLQRTAGGQGCMVVVEGRTGSGKSRLLGEAALLAQTSGLLVVRAAARAPRAPRRPLAADLLASLLQIAPLEANAAGAAKIEWTEPRMADDEAHAGHGAELRSGLQQALHELFCHVARARPLLLTIDDVDQADELSVALLGSLAYRAGELPLMLVCSRNPERAARSFDAALALRSVAQRIVLEDLGPADCKLLMESIFGSGPNIALLSDWMYRSGRGNPQLTIELAEQLAERRIVRYVEGAWVLPSSEIGEDLPQDLSQAWTLRMQGLSSAARSMAELLCVRRGGATADLCLAAGAPLVGDVFGALDELVRRGILESAGDDYVFVTTGLRRALQEQLAEEHQKQLHGRWADALLSSALAADVAVQLEAGFHLVRSTEPLRGADLVARVAPALATQGLAMETAIPAMEHALLLFEQHGRPLEARLGLRSALVLAGYLFDYKLVARYGADTLSELHRVSGLALATRLRPYTGAWLALNLAFAVTWLQRLVTPRSRRGPPVYTALIFFVRSAMGLLGVSALQLEATATARVLHMLTPLAAAPSFTSGRLLYLASRAFAAQIMGDEAENLACLRAALAEIRRGRRFDMTAYEHQNLLVGLLLADGMQEAFRESSKALERADALAASGGRIAEAAAERVRTLYYLRRGDFERAEHHRRQLDLSAIQHGTTWQVEWFALPPELMFGVIWSDLLMARRALERLELLAREAPGLTPYALGGRVAYHFQRGEHSRAAMLGERYTAAYPPSTLLGWSWIYGVYAFSLLELRQYARALEVTERAYAALTTEDRAFPTFSGMLEVAHAAALALSGQRQQATALIEQRIERMRRAGDYAELAGLYPHIARMAYLLNDRAELDRSLASMREAALCSGVSTAILLADRIAETYAAADESAALEQAPANDVEARDDVATATAAGRHETALATFLTRHAPRADRCREALRLLARCMASDEAYLYQADAAGPRLLATVGHEELPRELLGPLQQALNAPRGPAPQLCSIAISPADAAATREEGTRRYRIVSLPGERDRGWIAAVVLRDHGDLDAPLSRALLEDMGQLVAASHVRRADAPASLSRER